MIPRATLLRFLPAAFLTAGVAVLSLWENPQAVQALPTSDKVMHGAMYMVLTLSWLWPLMRTCVARTRSYSIIACVCIALYGALMELLQHLCTVSRSGDWRDIVANTLGVLAAALIVYFIHPKTT